MQSLVDRCPPLQDIPTLHSLIQTEVQDEVSQELRLVWETEKAWLNGEPVLAHSFGKWRRQLRIDMSEKNRFRTNSPVHLLLAMPQIETVSASIKEHEVYGNVIKDITHWVGLHSSNDEANAYGYFELRVKDLFDPSFSFLLPKNHGLDSEILLCVVNMEESRQNPDILIFGKLVLPLRHL